MLKKQADCSVLKARIGTHLYLFLAVFSLLILAGGCASPQNNPNLRPHWIDSPPSGGSAAVGAASYEIFGETKAREKALMKALTSLALQKGGTVDLESSVDSQQVLNAGNSGESFREQASIRTRAIVRGKEIPINVKIRAFWKDTQGRRIWVLVVEE